MPRRDDRGASEVERLAGLAPRAIREEWRRAHGEPPPPLPASLLMRVLCHQAQLAATGGMPRVLARRLQRLFNDDDAPMVQVGAALPSGTQLIRDWGGSSHHVVMLDAGRCSYAGSEYRSLSAVAKTITGAHWSGPRFFGLAT